MSDLGKDVKECCGDVIDSFKGMCDDFIPKQAMESIKKNHQMEEMKKQQAKQERQQKAKNIANSVTQGLNVARMHNMQTLRPDYVNAYYNAHHVNNHEKEPESISKDDDVEMEM